MLKMMFPAFLSITIVVAAACGHEGPAGVAGPPGPAGPSGPQGPAGEALSEQAAAGLRLSPVPIDISRLTSAQAEQVGTGSYLANIAFCTECHTADPTKFMAGGVPFALDAVGHVVYTRNLTPDPKTGLGRFTEDQFKTILRTGQDFSVPNGTEALEVDSWPTFRWMTDEDLSAIWAYLQLIPPVVNTVPPDDKGPFKRAPVPFPGQYNEGDVSRPLPPDGGVDPDNVLRGLAILPTATPSQFGALDAEQQALFGRGSYIVNSVADCNGCHTNPSRDFKEGPTYLKVNTSVYLEGGAVWAVPPFRQANTGYVRSMAANLIGASNGFFHEAQISFPLFDNLLATGLHVDDPDPQPLAWPMQWSHFRLMTLTDLEAVFTYLRYLDSPPSDRVIQSAARYCTADSDCHGANETCLPGDADAGVGGECVGGACAVDDDCDACQTCTGNRCVAPAAGSTCVTNGGPGVQVE
jgi:cytochrome c553